MEEQIIDFIEEAIKLELNVARLYSLFSENFEEDREFWIILEMEERNHAAILKTGKDFIKVDRFPNKILPEQLTQLIESNRSVEKCIDDFLHNPDRELAFKMAVELENSAGEAHFQHFMESNATDTLTEIFQKLNRADKDHAARILVYWQDIVRKKG